MKAFVTGANGFTGSHLVRALVEQGVAVTGLVRAGSDRRRLAALPVEIVTGDVGDRGALDQGMAGADWVFHTAAYVELGIVDGVQMHRINVDGTAHVMAAAQAANVGKIVHFSTIGIYGDTAGLVVDETFKRRQAGFDSPYDRTKYVAQQHVDRLAKSGLPVVSVMPSGIFGGDDPHFGPVIRQFLKGGLKVWAGGDRPTGIVHVDDLVAGAILAAEQATPGSHYILSAGDLTTREMFACLGHDAGLQPPAEAPRWLVRLVGNLLDPIGQRFNWQPPLSRERVRYIYDRCVRVSSAKARRELGWQPRPVPQVLADVVREIQATSEP
jgi:nucleoside-diphosphate-sugar epimerase